MAARVTEPGRTETAVGSCGEKEREGARWDEPIRVYGASWCPDCRRAKRFLADQRIPFEWHDVDGDTEGQRIVQERNGGRNIIPTIVFPDGSHLAEPSDEELADKIGLERAAMMHVYDLIVVGGGPTGLTTSIYAARENLQTLVIDGKGLGGQAGVTERLGQLSGFPRGDRRCRAGRSDRPAGGTPRRGDAPGGLGPEREQRR
jgi:glutaredoxin